jgi:alkanesulfonate monooxygenase SsuD/methylene tetrahydromethanopterin reductase-like flavin-dependent oxidoreductase (luciferase family)
VRIGLYVDSHLGIGPVAKSAEDAGLSHLWFYDSPLVFGDTSMAMLVAAQHTSRINIGPGVANPLQRPPEYTAQMLATLNVIAPGRVFLGLGIGNSARRSLGLPPARLADLRSHLETVRGMLSGDEAEVDDAQGERLVRFIHPHGPWIDIAPPVDLWLSAFGPAGQRIAAEVADGVLSRWEGPQAMRDQQERERAVARPLPRPLEHGVVYAVQPIADESELESAAMRAALGPLVVSRLRYLTANVEDPDLVPPHFRDGFVAYRDYREALDERARHLDNYRGYLVFTPPDLERFVTPESMKAVALVGSPERIAEELRVMAGSGVDHCSLQMAGDQSAWCGRMAAQVFPLLGAPPGEVVEVSP